MRHARLWIALSFCFLALTLYAWAQGRKAGLYEVTSNTTWQQSPFPAGMGPAGGPRTTKVCVSQEQIDKFGDVPPQTRGDCQVTNLVKKPNGYTADIACTGRMNSKGTVEASFSEDGHGKTKVHLLGSIQRGPDSMPVEMTTESESTYKGQDCGDVKPMPLPADK